MHMADALISPAVGGTLWAAAAGMTAWCAHIIHKERDERRTPMMGVLGAFIFSAQMLNFSIPGTGSSGHVGGGLLLAALLGPHAAFLALASVLTVQALFFADGGLLALGCNIINMGLFPCFLAYPLIYRVVTGPSPSPGRLFIAATLAVTAGLETGALGVVTETYCSGISELPFRHFALLMLPIHLAIGLVEGAATGAILLFLQKAKPEVLLRDKEAPRSPAIAVAAGFLGLAILTGGVLSWFASEHPDGLEWSLLRASGKEAPKAPEHGVHAAMAAAQKRTALLPDYNFKSTEAEEAPGKSPTTPKEKAGGEMKPESAWSGISAGKSLAGLTGGAMTLLLAGMLGYLLRKSSKPV